MSPDKRTLNIAHRGARSLAPENTLAAAHKALGIGADMWELDVGLTSDGELIIIHDDSLDRTSNARQLFPERSPWLVHQFKLGEIRRLDFGSWFNEQDPFKQIAAGAVTGADVKRYVGERAPTLREALAFTLDNDWRVNVEIKDLSATPGGAAVVDKVVALIQELGMIDRVLVSSFNHQYLEQVRAITSDLATGALVTLPDPDPPALLRRLHAQAYHPFAMAIQPQDIAALRKQGFDVNVWTVNDETVMRIFIEAGASGIFTDFPQTLERHIPSR